MPYAAQFFNLEYSGYTFNYVEKENGEYGILLSGDVDVWDDDYQLALSEALDLAPLIQIFQTLKLAHTCWHSPSPYYENFEQHFDRTEILGFAHKFIVQDELTVPDWIHQFADDLINNVRPPKPPMQLKDHSKDRMGYVYLLKSESGYYKIGKSKKPEDRIKTFDIRLPFQVEYECVIPSDDMGKLEKDLHARFESKRVNGEWFTLANEDIEYIKALVNG